MLAIVTGTVKPDREVGKLIIRDEEERLKQYIDSLTFLIESKAFTKIVFCENSNYGTVFFDKPKLLAKKMDIQLEVISFQGDFEQTKLYGKGFGEGEILDYTLKNSKLVKEEKFFVKITGRIKVNNIKEIVARLKVNRIYFNIPNYTQRDIYDTRIYAMPIRQFQKNFIDQYFRVKDNEGIFLEHVYTNIIKENRIKVNNFPKYPRITGVSGSTGLQYAYTEWKCKIKDVLSVLGIYKVRG